ncbi:MAG TPA: ABC transporter permease [Streptosporangiaceae bacterium]|nr:ABC transporter permease [Streptosporangiaceae bacterium]
MSDQSGAGHSVPPGATATAQDTGPPAPGEPRGRLTGSAIIQAVAEGHSAVITILAVFVALVIGGLLIVASDPVVLRAWDSFGYAPGAAFSATWTSVSSAYSALFEGSIFSPGTISAAFHGGSIAAIFYPLSLTAFEATPLILTGLSVAVAFRAGMFNIGAAGQWIGGALVATWLGYAVHLPIAAHAVVCVIGAFAGGAVIGWIVGEVKARTGAHEVILTIMLNYVMYNLLSFLLSSQSAMQAPGQTNQVAPAIAASAMLPHVGGPPPQAGVGFLIALAAAAALAWLLSRSTVGFQFRTVGASPSAARSAGIRVERVWVLAFLIAGGLAGLSAATIVQGQTQPLTFNSYGTYGFDGITVALLGRARPFGVVIAGLLFGALNGGGTLMEAATGVPADVVDVIKGLIVLLVAAPPLIRLLFRLRRSGGAGPQAVAAKGWSG